ncbi:hypothetical protein N7486_006636 [Penicillium sp. IBT 16267x]|nr:hypothetical protein N7486_006636 [Penicillium sp. IBT 16267x]
MSDSGTAFRTSQYGYPSSWSREEHPRSHPVSQPQFSDHARKSGNLEESMNDFHLKQSRKELERISDRMRARGNNNSICQLGEDASRISSTACRLIEEAGTIEFAACQVTHKTDAMSGTTIKTRADVANLEASVARLNETVAKIIKAAAKVCAQVAEMNVNMTRISAEVNDASASKAEEDMGGVRETAQEEWRPRNMAKNCELGDCDYWGGVGPWHTNMGSRRGSAGSYERRRSQNKGTNAASVNSYEWGSQNTWI